MKEYFASKGWLTKYAQAEDSRGMWQKYVDEVEANRVQDPGSMDHGSRTMYSEGQLVSNTDDGSRPGYGGDTSKVYNEKTGHIYPGGNKYRKWWSKTPGNNQHKNSLKSLKNPEYIETLTERINDPKYKNYNYQDLVDESIITDKEYRALKKLGIDAQFEGKHSYVPKNKGNMVRYAKMSLQSNPSILTKMAGKEGLHLSHLSLTELDSLKNLGYLPKDINIKSYHSFEKKIVANAKEIYEVQNNKSLSTPEKRAEIAKLQNKDRALRKEFPKYADTKARLKVRASNLELSGLKIGEKLPNPAVAISQTEGTLLKDIKTGSQKEKDLLKLSTKSLEAKIKELGGKEKLTQILTNGGGTGTERTLLKQIITGGNSILKGTGKFVAGALNPVDFFRLKNLIGLPAAVAAVAYDTVAIADDVFRKGQPFDVAAGNEFLTQFLDLNTESKQAQRILDDKGSNLSPAAKEYAEALVDFGKYKNLLKEKNDISKAGSLENFEEDQAKIDKQLKVLEEKMKNMKEDGVFDYQAAVNELGINEEQSEYIGEPKKAGMFTYAADDTNTIPKYPFLTEDMGTGQSRSDGFYKNADGNRIKVNEYGYATKGNIFDIPGKTGARVDKKLPYGETDQGRNPALLTEGEKIFRAETKQPAKYQKPFTYKDFNYQNKALSDEQYNNVLKYYQDQGFIKDDQRLEDVNIPKGYNKRIVNGKEYDPPKTFLQDTTEFFNIGDKWKQAIYQPGMLGAGNKFAEGGIANTRVGFRTGSSIASLLSKFFKPKKTITIKRGESGTLGASGNSEKDFFNRYYFPPKGGFTNQSADARYFSKLGGTEGKPKVLTAEITPAELREGYRLRSLDSKDPEIGDIIIPQSAKDKVKTDYYNTIRARIEKILKNND